MTGTAATIAALAGAEEIGRGRATMAGGDRGVVLCCSCWSLLMVVFLRRRRRRRAGPATDGDGGRIRVGIGGAGHDRRRRTIRSRRRRPASGRLDADPPPPVDAPAGLASGEPYATLAATPDLVGGSEAGEPGAGGAEPD